MAGLTFVQQRLASLLDPPIAFAHRGARAHARENTLEAFGLAVRLGATGLESDVWLTADGRAVLDHDGVVRSGLRRRPISSVMRAELPAHIPTLEDLLALDPLDRHLSLDLKDPAAAPVVIATITAIAPERCDRAWLCHPDLELLSELVDSCGSTNLVHSTRLDRLGSTPEMHAALLARRGIRAVNLHHTDWTGGLVALYHRFGIVCLGWDLQLEHSLRTALRMGLDGVFSDHVDVMLDAFVAEIGRT